LSPSRAGSTLAPNPTAEADLSESFDLSGLLEEFRDEARTQLDELDTALLKLERENVLDDAASTSLLRALHTLKGNAGMLGFLVVRDHVHALEGLMRARPATWPQPLLDRLFEGAATLRRAIEQAGTDSAESAMSRLASLPLPDVPEGGTYPRVQPPPTSPVEAADPHPPTVDAESEPETPLTVSTETLRVPFERLDELANHVAELLGIQALLEDLVDSNRGALDQAGLWRPLQRLVEQTQRVSGNLRQAATSLRLVPVGRVLRRFPSLVRDIAREQGKSVRVVLEGEETELDKSTVDVLGEPLLHLVRNAVDHGIGTPEEREAIGKPAEGTVRLRAAQAGDTVRIEVEDDGKGLDRERILEIARSSRLIAPDDEPAPAEIADLIFRPGFSTRRHADTVSGRGIGLDVVASSVARLRGVLTVEDAPGDGTRFVLELPLTVAILPVVIFEAAGETLALPSLDVEDIRRLNEVSRVAGADVVTRDDEVVPVARLERVLGLRHAPRSDGTGTGADIPSGAARYVLIVRRGQRAVGIAVDRVVDQRDVVIKALPANLGQPHGVSGATVAPDGTVVLLLDAVDLIDLNLQAHRRRSRAD
jgi:two-component system, chemotaxis family, sensor kinase CheA